jgi:Undecaprenyl-phosphate galactose phosphotransferase WbaP
MSTARPIVIPVLESHQRTAWRPAAWPRRSDILFLAADLLCVSAVAFVSVATWAHFGIEFDVAFYSRLWPVLFLFPCAYAMFGLYSVVGQSPADELRRLTATTSAVYAALAVTIFLLKNGESYSRATFLLAWAQTLVLVPLFRALVRALWSHKSWWGSPVVLAGPMAPQLATMLEAQPRLGLRPVAVLSGLEWDRTEVGAARRVILALGGLSREQALDAFTRCSEIFSEVTVIPDLPGFASLWVEAFDLNGTLGLEIRQRLLQPTSRWIKRVVDLVVVVAASVLVLPLAALIAAAIKLTSRGPVLYAQIRRGRGGQPFKAWKFRSMVANADEVLVAYLRSDPKLRNEWRKTQKLLNDPRITAVGRFLRRTSLDELPQFWNIFTGEMSLVGPRPIVSEEIARYGEAYSFYKRVTPGLTGLWQVSGRNRLSYEERVALDTYYIRNWSPWLDLYILARTVTAVLFARGAY